MKIGIVGDVHANYPQLRNWIEASGVNAVLQCGDFGCYEQDFAVPVFWVYGNKEFVPEIHKRTLQHKKCNFNYYSERCQHNNIMFQDYGVFFIDSLEVMGIGGAEKPDGDGYMIKFPDEAPEEALGQEIDILITHAPITRVVATSISGQVMYTDDEKLRKIVCDIKPKFVFSGHWHIDAHEEITTSKGTVIDSYIIGMEPRNWLIFDTKKYFSGEYPLDTLATMEEN